MHRFNLAGAALLALAFSALACNLPLGASPSTPAPTSPPEDITNPQPVVTQDTASPQPPAATEDAGGAGQVGTIQGALAYPSSFIPAQRVFVQSTSDPLDFYFVDTGENQSSYSIDVPAGTYYVFAYILNDGTAPGAGYTEFVTCGLQYGCPSHAMIPVTLQAGETLTGIDVTDWYATPEEDHVPPRPN